MRLYPQQASHQQLLQIVNGQLMREDAIGSACIASQDSDQAEPIARRPGIQSHAVGKGDSCPHRPTQHRFQLLVQLQCLQIGVDQLPGPGVQQWRKDERLIDSRVIQCGDNRFR
jgi:hypothetical protein